MGIRKVPRGRAAEVTAAIGALQHEPAPPTATPELTGRAHTFVITVAGVIITYELVEEKRIVKILLVE
jgi:hypothetical protein